MRSLVEGADGTTSAFPAGQHAEDYDRLVGVPAGTAGDGPDRARADWRSPPHPGSPTHSGKDSQWSRSHRWPGPATGRRCTTPGTRTIRRTPPSSCICSSRASVQHYHDPLLAGDHDLQELAKTYHQSRPRSQTARGQPAQSLPASCTSRRWRATGNPRGWNGSWTSSRVPTPAAVRAFSQESVRRRPPGRWSAGR